MLKLEKISKTFNPGTINEKPALRELSLHLTPGEFVTVIGGNGAGKSTMLNAVAGTWPVDGGRITIDGADVTALPEFRRARYIGRVFQDPMLGTAPDMWLEENLALALRRGQRRSLRWGITEAERKLFREQLSQLGLGLEDRMTSKVGLLSGGQRQALTLMMATMADPKLLLLDEHTAALDPGTAEKVLKLTREIVEQDHLTCLMITHNMQSALDPKTAAKVLELSDQIVSRHQLTTLMVTHNMRDAIRHGNRLIMLNAGKIVVDVRGEEKQKLTVKALMDLFSAASGVDEADDKLLLG